MSALPLAPYEVGFVCLFVHVLFVCSKSMSSKSLVPYDYDVLLLFACSFAFSLSRLLACLLACLLVCLFVGWLVGRSVG